MTAKEYIGQAYKLNKYIKSKVEQVEKLRAVATKCTPTLSDMPRSPSHSPCNVTDAVDLIIDLEAEIDRDIDTLGSLIYNISAVIEKVEDPDFRAVLDMRYLNFQKWEEISNKLHFSVRHLHRIHDEALHFVSIPKTCH